MPVVSVVADMLVLTLEQMLRQPQLAFQCASPSRCQAAGWGGWSCMCKPYKAASNHHSYRAVAGIMNSAAAPNAGTKAADTVIE